MVKTMMYPAKYVFRTIVKLVDWTVTVFFTNSNSFLDKKELCALKCIKLKIDN
jgi:hypothetical protein